MVQGNLLGRLKKESIMAELPRLAYSDKSLF